MSMCNSVRCLKPLSYTVLCSSSRFVSFHGFYRYWGKKNEAVLNTLLCSRDVFFYMLLLLLFSSKKKKRGLRVPRIWLNLNNAVQIKDHNDAFFAFFVSQPRGYALLISLTFIYGNFAFLNKNSIKFHGYVMQMQMQKKKSIKKTHSEL